MKKKFLFLPVLAALFAACTSDELVVVDNQTQQTEEDAIAFDAYLNRTVTRAGEPGILTTSGGTKNLRTEGFGVFAYYADGDLYSENAIPDFMYNQKVEYSGGWTYSPIKYWPNEFGSTAISTGVDRVTFFAYAPYVAVEPSTGQLTSAYTNAPAQPELSTETGITALTRNGKTGDPYVRYVAAFDPDKCVDLCYGVAAEAFKSSVGAADGANDIKAGDPYINVAKPDITSKIKFNFKHTLAQLTVKVDADVDLANHGEADALNENTRIWVRSITFDGVAQRGYLNLNNGIWYDVIDNTKISHASVTVHDGLRDGAEPLATDDYETPTGFNGDLLQSGAYTAPLADGTTFPYTSLSTATNGVTGVNKNLFKGTGTLLVIPANEQLKVTIVYDVETADATLPKYLSDGTTKGSTVENKITKSITLGGSPLKLDAGKAYTINLHLGMTSVKFDAEVSDWVEEGTGDVDLPSNKATATVAKGGSTSITIPAIGPETAGATNGVFQVTGLTAAATTTNAFTTITGTVAASSTVPASGIVNLDYSIDQNNTVKNIVGTLTVTEGTASTLNITQLAHPLGLSVSAIAADGKSITLASAATGIIDSDWNAAAIAVTRNRGGVTTNLTKGTKATGIFELNSTNHNIIELADADEMKLGDVYTVTVTAGDAPTETYNFTIGGIAFVPATRSIEYGYAGYNPAPVVYGGTLDTYSSVSSTAEDVATVASTSDPTITTVKVGSSTIQMTNTLTSPTTGYFFTTASQTSSYSLTVTKAAATITYNDAAKTDQPVSGSVDTYTAVLKNSRGDVLTAGAAAGGAVAYDIVSVKKSGADAENSTFVMDSGTGALTVGTTNLDNSTTYTVTVKATVTPNDNAGYAIVEDEAVITITTEAAP